MTESRDTHLTVYEGEDWSLKARLTDEDGSNLTQAAVDSFDVHVYLTENGTPLTEVYTELAIPESDWDQTALTNHVTIVDTLSTVGWSKDSTGWNMHFLLTFAELETGGTASAFSAQGEQTYLTELHFNRTAASSKGPVIVRIWVKVKSIRSI